MNEERTETCPTCKGTGADPMSDNVNWLPCTTCEGQRKVSPAVIRTIEKLTVGW